MPYIRIHPDNPTFYSKDGTLYFRENDKVVTESAAAFLHNTSHSGQVL
ncbi:hypothetical protein [Alloprevotella sp. Lung230]|nr:hypothetical protein [Alloprevotella sp. Lung230]